MKTLIALFLVTCFSTVALAQHSEHQHESGRVDHSHIEATEVEENHHSNDGHAHAEHGKHKISFYTGFTHIPDAFYEHETKAESTGKWVPTLGLDYWYTASKKIDLGVMFDVELDEYLIDEMSENNLENGEPAVPTGEKFLQRNNVVVAAVVAKYKPCHGLGLFVGPGVEWEFAHETKSFWVVKAGIEYEIEIEKGWEITPSLIYDFKEEYSAYSFGFSIGKRF